MTTTTRRHARLGVRSAPLIGVIAAAACVLAPALAPAHTPTHIQDQSQNDAPPQRQAPPQQEGQQQRPPADDLPSLDELLGIGEEAAPEAPATEDAARAELDRRLGGQEVGDAFRQAITLMGEAAGRIGAARDTSIGTQRIQEDVIRRLDQLIASLEQMQQQSSSSSSSSSSEGQRQPPSQQRPGAASQQAQGENQGEAQPPPRQEGALRPGLDAARSSWGALPTRVRDMLLQGSSDRFSSLYEGLTESYYRRLAEEGAGRN